MPKFSIIIPCFNAAETLPETLDSLRAQTCEDWECLLIDDGSFDGTVGLLERAAQQDARFRVFRNTGQGPSAARNMGARLSRSPILAFCDADDVWLPQKLTVLSGPFSAPENGALFARVAFFDRKDQRTRSKIPVAPVSIPMLMGENPVCTMSNLAVRKDVFLRTGGFDENMVHNEDLEWLIRLVGQGHRLIGVDHLLVRYRTSPTGLSADIRAMAQGRRAAIATAARFGFLPDIKTEAIYLRQCARRALRVDAPRGEALRFALRALAQSPAGFFSDPRRGGLTLAGALVAPILPARLRRSLFSA